MNGLKFDVSELFNSDVKAHFLEDYDVKTDTKRIYYNNFKIASKIEFEKKKDIYEMTDEEVEEILSAAMKASPTALNTLISNLRNYVDWCNGVYIERNFPLFADTPTRELVKRHIATSKLDFFTREHLLEILENFSNPMDKFIFLALFEGIGGRGYSELFNMKPEHLHEEDGKYFVDLYESTTGKEYLNHEISKELYELAFLTESTNTYAGLAKGASVFELKKTGYVMRKRHNSRTQDDRMLRNFISNNIAYYREMFGSDILQLSYITQSGIMHHLHELIKDQEAEVKIVNKEILEKLSDRFRFGTYFHSEILEYTYSYSIIRRSINKDWFERNYCKIEYKMK